MKLDPAIAMLPIGHLQLKGRARNVTAELGTIGPLVDVVTGRRQTSSCTGSTAVHIERVVRVLLAATSEKGVSAWDVFRKSRPPLADGQEIFFTSPSFARLANANRTGSVARLHLNRRAITALGAAGITTIGALINAARAGIVQLRASGELTAHEIVEALDALASSIGLDGAVDWITYAQYRRFAVLPKEPGASYSSNDFVRLLPKICEFAVASKFGSAGSLVLRTRLLRHPDISISLDDVGRRLGQTGEWVRLLEGSILETLSAAIWEEEYRGCRFRFRREFFDPLRRISSALRCVAARPLSLHEWERTLYECWAMSRDDLGHQEALILKLLGLEHFSSKAALALGTATETKRFLMRHRKEWLPADAVWQHVRKRLGLAAPGHNTLSALLHSMPFVEADGSGRYRIRFEHLQHPVDRFERILQNRGTPMHYREIASEVDRITKASGGRIDPRLVAMRMSQCQRFCAIGRTGLWALREWKHIETGTVADVAAELLSNSETPLSEAVLFETILPRRPVRRASIRTQLREDPRFVRVAPALWALRADEASVEVRRRLSEDRQ